MYALRSFRGWSPARFWAFLLLAAVPTPATAQLIPIRTVPVSQAHQFELFPSHTLAMGGIAIAVADSLLDPFKNPAKGTRLGVPLFAGSPAVYTVTSEAGGGRALPLGALTKTGPWYGGLWLALQQVDLSQRPGFVGPGMIAACPTCQSEGLDLGRDERSHGNSYAFAMLGRDLPESGMSLGASVFWAGLNAVDGVDLLYAGSARIKQFGHALDLRLGVLKELPEDRTFEMLLLHNRFGMTHDVFYLDPFWDPGSQQITQRPRLERNLDQTDTWGLHLAYQRPVPAEGWRVGWQGTVNYKSHPKIPNYEIMNIPRDPGHSAAFNLGLGVARTLPSSTFGLDFIYEPIWSYTWADSENPIETQSGVVIPPGGRTIENWFRFSNALLRMGLSEDVELASPGTVVGLQLGLMVRSIQYWLRQRDNIQLSSRNQEEQWVEWAPTWGLTLRRPTVEIRYRGQVTYGTGRPGVGGPPGGGFGVLAADAGGSNILLAPSGPLTLDPVAVFAHQISLSLPLRRAERSGGVR